MYTFCTSQRHSLEHQTCEANTNRTERRNEQQHINSWGPSHPLSARTGHADREAIRKRDWSHITHQTKLAGTCRAFPPTAVEFSVFSSTHRISSERNHASGPKTCLRKFKKIEIIFSNHNSMKLEINNRKNVKKFTNMWKLKTAYPPTTNESKEKSKGKSKKISWDKLKWKQDAPRLWDAAKAVLRG